MASSFIVGGMIDKYGRKPVIMIGTSIYMVSTFLAGTSQSYLEYLVFRFTTGIGLALWSTAGHVIIADITSASDRGKGVGMRNILAEVGTIVGPTLGAFIASMTNIRSAFYLDASTKIPMLIIFAFLLAETGDPRRKARTLGAPAAQTEGMRTLFKSKPSLIAGYTGFAVFSLRQGFLIIILPLYAKMQLGLSTTEIGIVLSIIPACMLAVALPGGIFLDRYGRKKVLVGSFAVAGLALALMVVGNGFEQVAALAIPFGLAFGLAQTSSQTFAMDIAPEGKKGVYLGFYNASTYAGVILGPMLAAAVADSYGFGASFIVLAVLIASSSILVQFLAQETLKKHL